MFVVLAFILQNASAQKENKQPKEPKNAPTFPPSITNMPSFRPTTPAPLFVPTPAPSSKPTSIPSAPPSTLISSQSPSNVASNSPTKDISNAPTEKGSNTPTVPGSKSPTTTPSETPSSSPTDTLKPTSLAADDIVLSTAPSVVSSVISSNAPTSSLAPSEADASPAPSAASSTSPSSMKPSNSFSSTPLSIQPSDSPSSTPSSIQPPATDSAVPTLSIAPSTSSPSQLPTILGASARPSMAPSIPPSMVPSTSSPPSDLPSAVPTMQDTTGFKCINDPAFSNLTADTFGNITDCAWFEYYIFNSCRDFGGWTDENGNTPNASCCVCGGGLWVDPDESLSPSAEATEPPTVPLRCGCRSCTEAIWNKRTGTSSFTCGDRISFLMSPSGGALSEERACYQIGHDEYPEDCKFCTPDFCVLDDPAEHFHCGCPTCTDEAWDRLAEGDSCGDRIMFLQNELNMERRKACEQVGFLEYPIECGACDPNTCASTQSSSGVRLLGNSAISRTMLLALPMMAYVWYTSSL